MSRTRLARKLQPTKRAWKSFTTTVQAKLHKLNLPKVIRTTIQRIASTLQSFHFLVSSKRRRSIAKPSSATSYHNLYKMNFPAVHIDHLFPVQAQGETSRGKEKAVGDQIQKGLPKIGINSIEDAWQAVVASSPQLRVDERAEEFIYKFREDMKLQKERSLLEFQEMLARSS